MTDNKENKIYDYWLWKESLPKALCNCLLDELSKDRFSMGIIGYPSNSTSDENIRNNKTLFLDGNHWIEGILLNYCRYANAQAGWGMIINGNQLVQVARYEEGEKYEWHQDTDVIVPVGQEQRKLTAVVQLSPSSDFEGGGLMIPSLSESILKEQGDVVVFPSIISHKADTVLKGVRYTAVLWSVGPRFC